MNIRDADEVREMLLRVPEPIARAFFVKCPTCGQRFWNSRGQEYAAYKMHYLDHLLEDLPD